MALDADRAYKVLLVDVDQGGFKYYKQYCSPDRCVAKQHWLSVQVLGGLKSTGSCAAIEQAMHRK